MPIADLKRVEVKYIRDISKSGYTKEPECYICRTTEELQLHHYHTVSLLWDKFKKENGILIKDVEDIKEHRIYFRDEHQKELYVDVVTLCKYHHHQRLHKVYGRAPSLATVDKQRRWCDRMRLKNDTSEK